MTKTIKITAAAVATMIAAFGGQAAAEDAGSLQAAQPAFVLANLYAAIDANQNRTFQFVVNTTETRMETKIAKIENRIFDDEFKANEAEAVFAGF